MISLKIWLTKSFKCPHLAMISNANTTRVVLEEAAASSFGWWSRYLLNFQVWISWEILTFCKVFITYTTHKRKKRKFKASSSKFVMYIRGLLYFCAGLTPSSSTQMLKKISVANFTQLLKINSVKLATSHWLGNCQLSKQMRNVNHSIFRNVGNTETYPILMKKVIPQ